MATRRMFSKEVTTSDVFVDMPSSTQLLYYHLGMEADDEGFLGNARMLSRAYGANQDDLKLLEAKGFIITFPGGIAVIKDWEVNNKIRKDRLKPTIYTEERKLLNVDNKGSYQLVNQMTTSCQPNDNQMSAQVRLGKVRLGKDRKDITPPPKQTKKTTKHKYGEYDNVLLSDDELTKLKDEFPNDWEDRIERVSEYVATSGKKYKNFLAVIRNWAKKEKEAKPQLSGVIDNSKIPDEWRY